MTQTLEVRWFYEGVPPDGVVDWFTALAPAQPSTRTDLYLIGTAPVLNVKLRAGQIQLKRRCARGPITLGDDARGYSECWQKWSFPLTDDAPDLFVDDPSGLWRPVKKTRSQRRYPPAEQRALLPECKETALADACIELTRVQSGRHAAWTICMEAEGRPVALPDTLRRMSRYVFRQGRPPVLDEQHSYGYAHWLDRIYA